ncbi:hypothetical protein GCK32_018986, partial [Trichostrongylus colubriformis]
MSHFYPTFTVFSLATFPFFISEECEYGSGAVAVAVKSAMNKQLLSCSLKGGRQTTTVVASVAADGVDQQ